MRGPLLTLCLAACALSACSEAQEAKRVSLPLVTDGEGLDSITTDLPPLNARLTLTAVF